VKCYSCPNAARPDHQRCPECAADHVVRTKAHRDKLIAEGRCIVCAAVPPRPGRQDCGACATRKSEQYRAKRMRLKAEGLCIQGCGSPAAVGRGGRCTRHADRNCEAMRRHYEGRRTPRMAPEQKESPVGHGDQRGPF